MISITKHIQYLLLHHDCVIVPGLGGFVAMTQQPAWHRGNLSSPLRRISFNQALTHDDGLLAGSVVRREGVSYDCARQAVESEVELLLRRIHHEGSVIIPLVGTLQHVSDDGQSRLLFHPADPTQSIASLRYRSLRPITVQRHKQLPSATDTSERHILHVDTRSNIKWAVMRYAASVAVLATMALTFSTPITAPKEVDLAGFPTPHIPASTYVEPASTSHLFTAIPNSAEATAQLTPRESDHYLIVASCSSLRQAKRFIAQHSQGTSLEILPSDGRYRIYAAAATDSMSLEQLRNKQEFRSIHPQAWIYTKP